MNSISEGMKGLFNTSIHLLNQPIIKENVKNIAGTVTFVFGLVEIYDIYQISLGREISTETNLNSPKWVQIANKVVIVCAKISAILSACVSRPGVFVISSLAGRVCSTIQLDQTFGPNTIFAVNPWHPRHIGSIAAVIFALPSVVQSAYLAMRWLNRKVHHYQEMPKDESDVSNWLTDTKIRLMTLFNTITSRPVLHIGNQLSRLIVRMV